MSYQDITASTVPQSSTNGKAWYSGRARRKEYWSRALTLMIPILFISLPLIMIPVFSASDRMSRSYYYSYYSYHSSETVFDYLSGGEWACVTLGFISALVCGIFIIPVTVRRLHDRNMSGWWMLWFWLLGWVPFVGWISGVAQFIIVGCLEGTIGDNRYGPDPKAAEHGLLTGGTRNGYSTVVGAAPAPKSPVAAKLSELQELRKSGLITKEEYEEKRSKIVASL